MFISVVPPPSAADQYTESDRVLLWRTGFWPGFDIVPGIQRLIYELVGLDILLPANMPDLPALELREQTRGLSEKGSDQPALDLVLAIDLPDEQLAVAENGELGGAELRGCVEGFYQACVLGNIVGCPPQENSSGSQLFPGGIGQREAGRGRTGVASAAAVYVSDYFVRHWQAPQDEKDMRSGSRPTDAWHATVSGICAARLVLV
jgi:hypothetical protein